MILLLTIKYLPFMISGILF